MDKKRKINNSKRKQQVKRQLYFMAAAVICIGIILQLWIEPLCRDIPTTYQSGEF